MYIMVGLVFKFGLVLIARGEGPGPKPQPSVHMTTRQDHTRGVSFNSWRGFNGYGYGG
jgi:hypothetical protein